ncbi:hypothetical protein EV401DRAFT_1882011 [Pisolithus croceorrhizus]|nr:hypothetical protein EV401DRAFT_1882011 [Pisolithus croceorrhizus]
MFWFSFLFRLLRVLAAMRTFVTWGEITVISEVSSFEVMLSVMVTASGGWLGRAWGGGSTLLGCCLVCCNGLYTEWVNKVDKGSQGPSQGATWSRVKRRFMDSVMSIALSQHGPKEPMRCCCRVGLGRRTLVTGSTDSVPGAGTSMLYPQARPYTALGHWHLEMY